MPSLQRPARPFLLQRPGKALPCRLCSAPGCRTRGRGFLEEQAPLPAAVFALVSGDACCPLLSGEDEVFIQEPQVGPCFGGGAALLGGSSSAHWEAKAAFHPASCRGCHGSAGAVPEYQGPLCAAG